MTAASPHLHAWRSRPVVGAALVMACAGFAQYSVTVALPEVAEHFGYGDETSLTEEAGLSLTALGVGLAIIRLSSLASLPLAATADRTGRRPALLGWAAAGLTLAALAGLSPGYWWFVAVFALARPLLVAADAVAEVVAAEQTPESDRAKAIALVSAAYSLGAGAVAVARGAAEAALGFRGVFALIVVPLALLPLAGRLVTEPDRFRLARSRPQRRPRLDVLGGARHRSRLAVMTVLAFATAVVVGPINTFLFLYAENEMGMSSAALAATVIAAAPFGLAGLLVGRALADGLGRRVTGAGAVVLLASAGVLTYSGGRPAVVVGYFATIFAGGAFAAPAGALATELFPTEVRSSVAGWLVGAGILGSTAGLLAFGALVDALDGYRWAAVAVCAPAVVVAPLVALVPETRGRELEESSW